MNSNSNHNVEFRARSERPASPSAFSESSVRFVPNPVAIFPEIPSSEDIIDTLRDLFSVPSETRDLDDDTISESLLLPRRQPAERI